MIQRSTLILPNEQAPICLSPRLMQLAAWISRGSKVLDVGTDHALLPIYLVQSGRVKSVIAGDVVEGPYQTAQRNVKMAQLESTVDVRLGSGLSIVERGEVDTVVIAGMGGGTIAEILDEGRDVLACVKDLLLQPMNAAGRLREALQKHGFVIVDEQMVEESGRVYQLIFAQTSTECLVRAQYQHFMDKDQHWLACEFGPLNLSRREEPFVREAVEASRDHFQGILNRLPVEAGDATTLRREEIARHLSEMESWLKEEHR